jgi:type IV pilus assembly protein PilC
MSRYSYTARNTSGAVIRGVIEAEDKRDVRSRLRQRNLYATSIDTVNRRRLSRRRGKVNRDEIGIFAEQLAVMIDAGTPLVRSLATLTPQYKSELLRRTINETRQDVENGTSFAESLAKHPYIFPKLFVSLVRAGELGGVLDKVLRQLADYMDKERQTKQMVKSALVYPKIVFTLCILLSVFMLVFIVPRFAMLYEKLGLQLPLPTVIIMSSSQLIINYWWAILIVVIALVFTYKKLNSFDGSRELLDKIKLRLPVIGELNRKSAVVRFLRVFSALNSSGVTIIQSLEVSKEVLENIVIRQIIDGVIDCVREGGNLDRPLSAGNIFPTIALQMLSVGEETGRLGEALEKSADYLERDLDATVKRLISRLEPALTIIVAVMVGIFAAAIYLPMFDVIKEVSRS